MTVGAGDEVMVPAPAWPNLPARWSITAARACSSNSRRGETWRLDPERLAAAVTPATRAIFFNSPANPTGYVATAKSSSPFSISRAGTASGSSPMKSTAAWSLAGARAVVPRHHGAGRPASCSCRRFEELGDDRLAHRLARGAAGAGPMIENLVQYSTSGVPVSAQRAAVAAIEGGRAVHREFIARLRRCRDIISTGWPPPAACFARPEAAFYLFRSSVEHGYAPAGVPPGRRGGGRRCARALLSAPAARAAAALLCARARADRRGDAPAGDLDFALKRAGCRRTARHGARGDSGRRGVGWARRSRRLAFRRDARGCRSGSGRRGRRSAAAETLAAGDCPAGGSRHGLGPDARNVAHPRPLSAFAGADGGRPAGDDRGVLRRAYSITRLLAADSLV